MAPVGITLGEPRFPLGFELTANVRLIAPTRAMLGMEDVEFRLAYRHRLDGIGVERIAAVLSRFDRGEGLVLLCFEDVAREPCHRRHFARWWEERTGRAVPELDDHSRPAPPASAQLWLDFTGAGR